MLSMSLEIRKRLLLFIIYCLFIIIILSVTDKVMYLTERPNIHIPSAKLGVSVPMTTDQ